MKKETQSLEHVGMREADPFAAALWAYTAKMDAALKKDEKGALKATAAKESLARQIRANTLSPHVRTR